MENYIVSARKYRPSTFATVVGQQQLTTTLKNAIKNDHLAHAYLFCGPRGVGKTTCARIFAKTINCQNLSAEYEACNECESCRGFNEQRSFNIHELDAASNNSVDEIRSLIEQVRIPPQVGKYSVYIIDEVHMLSQSAFNAFLKTLEEPPVHAIFILATTEKHKILPTILSRCQIYDFNRITIKDTVNHLKYVAEKEGIKASPEALNVIAQKSDGGMRDALSIFDQMVSFCGNTITYENAIETLNVLDYEYYFRLVDYFLKNDVSNSLLVFNEILNKGFDAQYFVSGLSSHLRDVLVSENPETTVLLEVSENIAQRYKQQAQICPANFIFEALKISNECDLNYRTAKNKRLLVELMLIRLCQIIGDSEKKNETRNLAPIKVATQTSANPITTPAATPKTNVVTDKQTTYTKPVTVKKEQPATTLEAKPMSISIMSGINTPRSAEKSQQPQAEAIAETVKNRTCTNSELQDVWHKYMGKVKDNMRLVSILQLQQPHLISSNEFEVTVSTSSQENELLRAKQDLMKYMYEQLGNNQLQMRITIVETRNTNIAFTAEDKYQVLLNKNQDLKDFKTKLGLRIE